MFFHLLLEDNQDIGIFNIGFTLFKIEYYILITLEK